MSAYGTKLAEGFSQKVISLFFENSIAMEITNQDYEGEIKDKLSKLNILTFGAVDWVNYTGADVEPVDPSESIGILETNVQKAYNFKITSLAKFHSWIKNPEGTLVDGTAKKLKQLIDTYILGLYADVASGNVVGTDFSTGTCTVVVTSGVVTHSATGFTAAMVGCGFKAVGHTKWYRIKAYNSTSEIVIEDDLDDVASAYTGGAISGGTSFVIQGYAKVQVAKTTIYGYITQLTEKLNEAQIPMEDRWLVLPPKIYTILKQAGEIQPAVDAAYQDVIKKGYVGDVDGFKVVVNNQVTGNNTDGYRILAMHRSWCTFAMGWTESEIQPIPKNFGKMYLGLAIYGAKIVDERRKAAAELFCYV